MLRVQTEFSEYEIDTDNKRVRRLAGVNPATNRQGKDGEWKTYVHLDRMGGGYFFDWDGLGHGTVTSPVVLEHAL